MIHKKARFTSGKIYCGWDNDLRWVTEAKEMKKIKFDESNEYNICYTKRKVEVTEDEWDVNCHLHEFYELEIFLSGSGKTVINQSEYEVRPGSVFLITPSDVHKYIIYEDAEIVNLTFTPAAVEYSLLIEKLYPMEHIAGELGGEELKRLLYYTEVIYGEATRKRPFNKKYISLCLSCILVELYRTKSEPRLSVSDNHYYLPVQKALYYMRAHFKEDINLDTVAAFAGIPPTTLSKKFPKICGTGFKEYLVSLRLDYAEMLIKNTDEQITEIAYYSGFNSLSYFHRVFVGKFGKTPKQYRKGR